MKLFLSSYRFGSKPQRFRDLTEEGSAIAVIAAAADAWPASARASGVVSDVVPLQRMGYEAREVDLRDHIGDPDSLAERLKPFQAVWVRGGNTFVLRAQLARSGADTVIGRRVAENSLVYAGYSAGACVAAPTLVGLDSSDDPAEVRPTCRVDPLWDGLGFVDFSIVPHFPDTGAGDSTAAAESVPVLGDLTETGHTVAALRAAGIEYRTLTDDEAIVVDSDGVHVE
ncbi:Type 1 glutamine amidotransferase-like domain-containing protein [Rhodococcus sp. NPDC058521]|uniref:Type 1 glutamine amidotransferase-like domain-containing protein n=1 Tax=Rhodococcus sp. NPDC058521 TaxID=3346536 RepID=UPI00365ED67E